ncbi:MAG: autotransporter-associated beta strand repeat-containing protein, partial [Verrucomicrobiota bacterium]
SYTSFTGAHSIELSGKLGMAELTQNRGFVNDITTGVLTLSGGMNLSAGVAGANVIYIGGAGTTNITGVIANNSLGTLAGTNLTYLGSGTLTLSGANTYTGTTYIGNGGGTIKLDFSAATAPQNNIILSGNVFQMTNSGGTLNLVGSATQDNSQTFGSMQFANGTNFGGAGSIVMTPNGHNLLLNTGGFTAASGGVTDITLSGASTATNGVTTTNSVDAGGLFKYFTVGGNDWAAKSGSNIVAYSGYTTTNTLNTWAASSGTVNFSNNATADYTGALGNNTTVNTVRFDSNVASGFDLGTKQLTVNDGILVTGNVSGKALTISNGSLVSNTTGNADLVIINNGTNGTTLDISANLTNTNTAVITKSGQGLVSLSGTGNTFGGRVSLAQGVLKVADAVTTAVSMGTSAVTTASNTLTFTSTTGIVDGQQVFGAGIASGITVVSHTGTTAVISGAAVTLASGLNIGFGTSTATNSLSAATNIQLHGGVLGLTSDFTRSIGTGPGQFQWGASGGFAAYGADRTVNIGGNVTPTQMTYTNHIGEGSVLTLSASSADAMVTLLNPIDLAKQSATIKVDNGSAAIDARLSGVITSSNSGMVGIYKTGLGTLQLNAVNTYWGITQVSEGTLSLSANGSIAVNSQLIVDGATAVFDLGANKNQTSTSAMGGVVLDNGGSITGTGTSTLTGQAYDFRSGTVTAILGNSAATTMAPVTTLTKTTSGTVTLTGNNTYQGATTISAGTLQLGNGNSTGSLSTSSAIVNNANLTINRSNAVAQGTDFSAAAITGNGSFTQAGTGTT